MQARAVRLGYTVGQAANPATTGNVVKPFERTDPRRAIERVYEPIIRRGYRSVAWRRGRHRLSPNFPRRGRGDGRAYARPGLDGYPAGRSRTVAAVAQDHRARHARFALCDVDAVGAGT